MHVVLLSNYTLLSCIQSLHERHENNLLKAENDKLIAENMRYKEALLHASCPRCGGLTGEMSFDEQQLRAENMRIREEVITLIIKSYNSQCSIFSVLIFHFLFSYFYFRLKRCQQRYRDLMENLGVPIITCHLKTR